MLNITLYFYSVYLVHYCSLKSASYKPNMKIKKVEKTTIDPRLNESIKNDLKIKSNPFILNMTVNWVFAQAVL